jgi:arabinose-5-phosphate isomerase
MLGRSDVVVALSNSGETEEVLRLLPLVKRLGSPLIAITGGAGSTLARAADVVLDVSVVEEACPLGLAPTASTTAALAMGDALAMALLQVRGFRQEDFALLHPGGSLGRRLFLKVEDLMHTGGAIPVVRDDVTMRDAIVEMTAKRLGCTAVLDRRGALVGIVTDGDLRRGIARFASLFERRVSEVMSRQPKTIEPQMLAAEALRLMEDHQITALLVHPPRRPRRVVGILHLHDLLRAGVA